MAGGRARHPFIPLMLAPPAIEEWRETARMARRAKYFSVKWKTAAVQTAFWIGAILGFILGVFVAMPHV